MTDYVDTALFGSCIRAARNALGVTGGASVDVVDTLARKYVLIAERYREHVRCNRETDDVIALAVDYMAQVHVKPGMGTGTEWFEHTLATLMELAVPKAVVMPDAADLLPRLQEGISESLAAMPMSRDLTRVTDDDAQTLRRMQDAGVEHGVASDLLDTLEKLYFGDPLDEDDQRLFRLAAYAAPMTRFAREPV